MNHRWIPHMQNTQAMAYTYSTNEHEYNFVQVVTQSQHKNIEGLMLVHVLVGWQHINEPFTEHAY